MKPPRVPLLASLLAACGTTVIQAQGSHADRHDAPIHVAAIHDAA